MYYGTGKELSMYMYIWHMR